jgi:hypothetical protein
VRLDDGHRLGLLGLAEVELEEGAGVPGGRRRPPDGLWPVDVAQGDVARGRGKPGRRDGVLDPDGDLVFAATWDRPVGEQVRQEHVDPIRTERRGHGRKQEPHAVGVGLVPVLGGPEQRRRVAEPPLGHERHAGHQGRLAAVPGRHLHHRAGVGRDHPGDHGDADRSQQARQRLQAKRRIVVAGDGHHGDGSLVQPDQRVEHQGVGLRGG